MQAVEGGVGCFDCLLASESCTVVEHVRFRKSICDGGACEK